MEEAETKDYFERRAAEEREAADQAQDVRAAQSHREMARRYDEKARNLPATPAEDSMSGLPREFRILP